MTDEFAFKCIDIRDLHLNYRKMLIHSLGFKWIESPMNESHNVLTSSYKAQSFLWKALIPLIVLMSIGIVISYVKAPFALGSGDHMLFHAFGHWLANGEVFTRDFIHFRTPGPYYYYGLMQSILGENFRSTSIALLLEAHLFQVIASYILTLAFTRTITGKPSIWIATAVGVFFLIAPPIYQLRTAFPAASLALYIFSVATDGDPKYNNPLLGISGVLLGICFWFGQELFVFLSLSFIVAEISLSNRCLFRDKLRRLVTLAVTALIPILLGVGYFFLAGVNIYEFFYNTTYYAFFIQPKGMDLPFPSLDMANLVYYAWIAVYCMALWLFTARRKIYSPAVIAFFAYAGMRMISMFGRADFLHLLFSISELVILIAMCILVLLDRKTKFDKQNLIKASVTLVFFIALFSIAALGRSGVLILIPFCLLALSFIDAWLGGERDTAVFAVSLPWLAFSGVAGLFIALLLIYPNSVDNLKFTLNSFSRTPQNLILGVQTTKSKKMEFDAVQNMIKSYRAESIFSYPIRAEFYAFTEKHGTRFIEFAQQTTPADVSQAIADLAKNQPELVFQDLDQVSFLSPILNRLSNYVYAHYEPVTIIEYDSHLQVLKKRAVPIHALRLFDNVYTFNPDHSHVTAGVRTLASGQSVLVIAINTGSGTFKFADAEGYLALKVYSEPGASTSGTVRLRKNGLVITQSVDVNEGTVYVKIPAGSGQLDIQLQSSDATKSVLWQDPVIEEIRQGAQIDKKVL